MAQVPMAPARVPGQLPAPAADDLPDNIISIELIDF